MDRPIRVVINALAKDGVETFDRIRSELGFESRKLNNESYANVLRTIDKRMNERLGLGLKEYLYRSEAKGGKPLYYSLLNIIDTANYWGDKKTEHSEIARVYDASHAYFASVCDILVTNDKRMREKVKAIFSFLGVKTRVMSVKEMLLLF